MNKNFSPSLLLISHHPFFNLPKSRVLNFSSANCNLIEKEVGFTVKSDYVYKDLMQEIVKVKDVNERKFGYFTNNFYLMKSALRYFAVKQGRSLTSSKIADNFPMTSPVAGSCLDILDQLEVVEQRTESNSPHVYMPEKVDMEKMDDVEKVLKENFEIKDFY